jgi:hypothetical protein
LAAAVRTTSLEITTIWVFAQTLGNGIQPCDHEDTWNTRGPVAWGAPDAPLSAVAWGEDFDGPHVRVYYLGMDGVSLREACWDGGGWQDGAFSAHAGTMSPLAATGWRTIHDDLRLRVYYEPNPSWVQESRGPQWDIGACRLRVAPARSSDLTPALPSA